MHLYSCDTIHIAQHNDLKVNYGRADNLHCHNALMRLSRKLLDDIVSIASLNVWRVSFGYDKIDNRFVLCDQTWLVTRLMSYGIVSTALRSDRVVSCCHDRFDNQLVQCD